MPFKDDSFFPSQFHDDMSNMGICVFDHKGKFLYMNDSFLGIRNVNRRIKIIYGGDCGLTVKNSGNNETISRITLKMEHEGNKRQ